MNDVLRVALAVARARRAALRETASGSGPGTERPWISVRWFTVGLGMWALLALLVLAILLDSSGSPRRAFAGAVNGLWIIVSLASIFLGTLRPGPTTWRLARAPVSPVVLRLGLSLAPLAGGRGLFTLAGLLVGTGYLVAGLGLVALPGAVVACALSWAAIGPWANLLSLVGGEIARASAGRILYGLLYGAGALLALILAGVAAAGGTELPGPHPGAFAAALAAPESALDVPRGVLGLLAWGVLGLALAEPLLRRATRLPARRRGPRVPRLPRVPVLTGDAGTAAAARLAFLARQPVTWVSLVLALLAGAFLGDPVLGRPGWGVAAYLPCLVPAFLAVPATDRFQVDRRGAVRWILAPVRPLAVLLGQDLAVLFHVALLAGLGHLAARTAGLSPAPGAVTAALPGPLLLATATFAVALTGSALSLLRPHAPLPAIERSHQSSSPVEITSFFLLGYGLGPLSLVPGWFVSRGRGGAALAAAAVLFLVAAVSWWTGTRAVARRYRAVGSRFLAAFSVPWA